MSYNLEEVEQDIDDFREALSESARDSGLEQFAEAVLDPKYDPPALFALLCRDLEALGVPRGTAETALVAGSMYYAILNAVHVTGERALAPETGDDN